MRIVRYIAYLIAALWIASILWASEYCFLHGCSGQNGNNIDGFLLAFALAPIGAPAFIWSLILLFRWARRKSPNKPHQS
jgi:hypothetical protein